LSAAFAAGLVFVAAPASATVTWYSPITAFQDDNLDFVFDNDNSGTISVGDRLLSVFKFENSQGTLAGQGPTGFGTQELTGVADVTVVNVLNDGTLIFGASGAAGALSGFAAGTTAAVFLDSTPDLNVINAACGDQATCMSLAGLGGADGSALYLTVGFFGDPDELWASLPILGGGTISVVEGGGSSTPYGIFGISQSVGVNNTGFAFGTQACAPYCGVGGDGLVQVTGNGNILGGQSLNHDDWTARSDTDFQLVPLDVPEPGSLALVGLALAGLGAMRRRAD
jgi:hypothetical protein